MGDEVGAGRRCFLAAITQMRRSTRPSWLKTGGEQVAARRGRKKAVVAVARKLAVTLHSMWVNDTESRWSASSALMSRRTRLSSVGEFEKNTDLALQGRCVRWTTKGRARVGG